MAECLFEKVFDGLKLSANVKTVLKNTLVDNLSISTKGRKMIVDLSSDIFIDEADGWTVLTEDGYPSSQWEYTVLVTETGVEVLTH